MNFLKNKWSKFFIFEGARPYLLILLVCLCGSGYLGLVTPKLITNLSKFYVDDSAFKKSIMFLLVNFILVYINRIIYGLAVNKYVRELIYTARMGVYSNWLDAHEVDSDKYPQGEILSRIMSDTEAIRELITSGAFGIFIDLTFIISSLIGFINLHRTTGIFITILEIFATLLLIWGSSLMREMFMRLRNSQANVNRVTANVLGGIPQLFYTRNDSYAIKKTSSIFEIFLDNQNKVNTMDALYYAIAESLYPVLLALLIVILPFAKLVEVALIFSIIDLIQRSINPIKEISGKMANIQRAQTGIDRIIQFNTDLNLKKTTESSNSFLPSGDLIKMEVDIPHFAYEARKGGNISQENFELNDIKFISNATELVGIVGLSGSGKSTLLKILSGNLKAKNIKVNLVLKDKNVERILSIQSLEDYKKEVSIVSQESHIFSETFLFNMTLNQKTNTDFEVFFNSLTDHIPYLLKWKNKLNERLNPKDLSLGERQLLSAIRACYLKKNIVFFDEISSALDSELELSLRKMILYIQRQSLTIIVAHRVETIIGANQILVMEKGRVVDSGIHQDLIVRSKIYQDFISELSHS